MHQRQSYLPRIWWSLAGHSELLPADFMAAFVQASTKRVCFYWQFFSSWLLEPPLGVASYCHPRPWLGCAGALLGTAKCLRLTLWLHLRRPAPSVALFYWQFFSSWLLEPPLGVASYCHPSSWLHFTEIKIECVSEMTR